MATVENTAEEDPGKKRLFWAVYIVLLCAFGYGLYSLLKHQVYNAMLWKSLVEDIDHRWKPYEREDINGDGIRSAREADEFVAEEFNIIFAGDSYTFGHLLKDPQQAPPMQFEQIMHQQYPEMPVKVANFGWSSSSPYLSLRLLRDIGKKYKPDLVIFILDITDFKDDFFYKNVIYKKGHYKFLIENPLLGNVVRDVARKTDGYTGWQQQLLGYPDFSTYFVAHQPYEQSVPFFDNATESLLEMHDYVTNELNAKFVVFMPPRHWQYTDNESPNSWEKHNYVTLGPHVLNNFVYYEKRAQQLPFPFVPLLEDFKATDVYPTTFDGDSHWNSQGAKLAAELIYQHCLRKTINCFE